MQHTHYIIKTKYHYIRAIYKRGYVTIIFGLSISPSQLIMVFALLDVLLPHLSTLVYFCPLPLSQDKTKDILSHSIATKDQGRRGGEAHENSVELTFTTNP